MSRSAAISLSGVPARSLTATRACVAPRSATSTTPAAWLKARTVGGRPPVDALPPASRTSPAPSSASTRCATVERASPVWRARSARVVAVPLRISSSSAPALVGEDGPSGEFVLISVQSTRQNDGFDVLAHFHRELFVDNRTKPVYGGPRCPPSFEPASPAPAS